MVRTDGQMEARVATQLTSFVGRERAVSELTALVAHVRLLTLTGVGGVGKTRLALEVAGRLARAYPDGVHVVELAALAEPERVPRVVAERLDVREERGRPLVATLADALRTRRLLLVLDNCEHLIDASARLAEALLSACPSLRILATSREPLDIAGETVRPVPPLDTPAAEQTSVEEIARSEAVRLFVDRAMAALPGFAVTPENAPALARLCRRLDGIPLAIELASARLRVLTPEGIEARLDDRFRLLTGGSRTALPRHQTLRALVSWSYDLLSGPERALLGRLSVFMGTWTLEAAESLCAGANALSGESLEADEILDVLSRLVDKSLVVVEKPGGQARYRLLETIRQYALEKLRASGHEVTLRRRHRAWYLKLAERAEPRLQGPELATWLDRLEREWDNLRLALDWSAAEASPEPADPPRPGRLTPPNARVAAQAGLRLGRSLGRFWSARGYLTEGRAQLARVLALPSAAPRTLLRAQVLLGAGRLAYEQGDHPAARPLFEECLAIAREVEDHERVGDPLVPSAGRGGAARGNEQALAIRRALVNRLWIAASLGGLGLVAHAEGDLAAAGDLFEAWAAIAEELNDRRELASARHRLGELAVDRGDLDGALARFSESLALWRQLGDDVGQADVIEGLAGFAAVRGQPARALRLAGWAAAAREAVGVIPSPVEQARLSRALEPARRALGERGSADRWAEGRALSPDQATAEGLGTPGPEPRRAMTPDGPPTAGNGGASTPLTPREREIVALIAQGRTNRQIADLLIISKRTADNHVANILAKLDLGTRSQVAVWAVEQNLPSARSG